MASGPTFAALALHISTDLPAPSFLQAMQGMSLVHHSHIQGTVTMTISRQ